MRNGHLTENLRIVASLLISLTCVICSTYVVAHGGAFDPLFWMVAVLAVTGVAGEQVGVVVLRGLEAIYEHRKGA